MPMACDRWRQAAESVRLMPRRLKITERFIVTVEFIDWKMLPEPTIAVFRLARMMSIPSITGAALLSLP